MTGRGAGFDRADQVAKAGAGARYGPSAAATRWPRGHAPNAGHTPNAGQVAEGEARSGVQAAGGDVAIDRTGHTANAGHTPNTGHTANAGHEGAGRAAGAGARAGDLACPGCGDGFTCGADRPVSDPCWCTRVNLPGLVLERLATTFEGCLCPSCLGGQAAGTEP